MAKVRLVWDDTKNTPSLGIELKKKAFHTFKAEQEFKIRFQPGVWPGKGWGPGNSGTKGAGGGPVNAPADGVFYSGDTPNPGTGDYEVRIIAPASGPWATVGPIQFGVLMKNPATGNWNSWDPRVIPD